MFYFWHLALATKMRFMVALVLDKHWALCCCGVWVGVEVLLCVARMMGGGALVGQRTCGASQGNGATTATGAGKHTWCGASVAPYAFARRKLVVLPLAFLVACLTPCFISPPRRGSTRLV